MIARQSIGLRYSKWRCAGANWLISWSTASFAMADWLLAHFEVYGIQFQNWMLVIFAIVVIGATAAASSRTS